MEPLIFALIIMAVSAFFSNKKKGEEKSSQSGPANKPQSTAGRSQGGFKRMEDYAKEIYGEFQAQMNPETDRKEQAQEAAKKVVEKRVSDRTSNRHPARDIPALAEEEIGGRPSRRQKKSEPVQKLPQKETGNMFPLSQSDAQKGIILAEVFMPPKSKRK